ncbi:S1/P1 nuclease [Flagellimonas lutaonensis]|uniref:S1/P1 Nuclease n=1 Tax=Flagellimonas lutaonensis TaxID=516051 RepID=A0A0D5YVJ7_9FLAO|nr:S1/P1 nuclease [Allomuricauda lutaonensis]AKA35873.1 S1/P1 Nuclease [Allomuricauda lutaonensis]
MRKVLLIIFLLGPLVFANDLIWSKTGHRAIGEIAQQHLTRKAERAIAELLGGHDLAFVANFADEIKADRSFSKFSAWHYVNYPADKKYTEVEPSEYGDVVIGIEKCIEIVQNENSPREDRVFYLKMLIHLVGDLHQPMHVGRLEDRGGNDLQVRWFDEGTNLHRLWDKNLIDSYGMSYTELAQTLPQLSKKEIKRLQQGTVYDWVEESQDLANELYDSVKVGEKLGYQYSYRYNKVLLHQLHLGGLRLAKVLNDLFDRSIF